MIRPAFFAACTLAASPAWALDIVTVTEGVWALVGETEQRSPENLGNNATFGVIVTPDGVVLTDPGGSWKGAEAIHAAIRTLTDLPVRYVIDTGGQDHRWLGNGYWRAQGATIIASAAALADQRDRVDMQMVGLHLLIGDAVAGTEPTYADTVFDDAMTLDFGGLSIEIIHPGPAHTPGDSYVWIAAKDTVFAGDIVYLDRILGVGEQSSILEWPAAFEALAAHAPAHIVPGHGGPGDLAQATAQTYDYLVNLRARIGALIEAGGDLAQAAGVDQSAFSGLAQFDSLAGKNAEAAFVQMEFE
jgi:glyoxylase-like metal-dependent hydrolase (beta-lactamase superfamily II)